MKKQKGQILGLLLFLAVLVGAFYGLKEYNRRQASKPTEDVSEVIVNVAGDDIVSISYDYEGQMIQLEKEDDTWYPVDDHFRAVRKYYVTVLTGGMAPLEAMQTLEDVSDLSQYGLDEPRQTITFETAERKYQICVGDNNSMIGGCYIRLADRPGTVYIVKQTYVERYEHGLEDILEELEDVETEMSE